MREPRSRIAKREIKKVSKLRHLAGQEKHAAHLIRLSSMTKEQKLQGALKAVFDFIAGDEALVVEVDHDNFRVRI